MTITLINNPGKLNALIGELKRQGANYSAKVHLVAYNAIAHVENTGDIRVLQNLYNVMTGTVTRKAIVQYALAFGKVSFDKEAGTFKFAKGKKTDLVGAESVDPFSFERASRPRNPKAFDLAKELQKLIDKASKEGITGDVINAMNAAKVLAA